MYQLLSKNFREGLFNNLTRKGFSQIFDNFSLQSVRTFEQACLKASKGNSGEQHNQNTDGSCCGAEALPFWRPLIMLTPRLSTLSHEQRKDRQHDRASLTPHHRPGALPLVSTDEEWREEEIPKMMCRGFINNPAQSRSDNYFGVIPSFSEEWRSR